MATNTDALNDPNYNPDIDAVTLQIFNMMDEPSDELYAQYKTIFDNLPATNPYSGVLVNPNTCDIQDVNNSVAATVRALQDYVNQNYHNDPTWHSEVIDPSNADSVVSQLTGGNVVTPGSTSDDGITTDPTYVQPNSVLSATSQAQDHTDKLLANLPMILGIVQQALGLATALGGLLNPCLGMRDFLGSLMGDLNKMLKAIKAAIDKIMGYIEEGIQAIKDAIAYVMNLVSELINFIMAEIKKLIKALIDALRAGLAAFLKSLGNDPCLKSLVGGITTMATAALL